MNAAVTRARYTQLMIKASASRPELVARLQARFIKHVVRNWVRS